MTEPGQESQGIAPEVFKGAMKAFRKWLKLTALDEDSRLGQGHFGVGRKGYAITPPSQFPKEMWEKLVRQSNLRNSGYGLFELNDEHL